LLHNARLPHSSTLTPLVFDYLPEDQTQLALVESAAAVELKSVPAAESSAEALERLRCEYNSNDDECVICLEKVLCGSQLIRMPCSHMFHSDCISRWLGTSHS
ncbi:43kDa postsynaptic protein, partial [Parasponia andersonii]